MTERETNVIKAYYFTSTTVLMYYFDYNLK